MVSPQAFARCLGCAGLIVTIVLCRNKTAPAADSSPPPPPPFEWNVYLDHWQVLGPFPKLERDQRSGELDRQLVPDETQLRPGERVTVDGKNFEWRDWPGRMVDFIRALNLSMAEGQYALAYAYTEFTSDTDQPAILAFSHDDCVVVWLNGEEIHRNEAWVSSELDQGKIKVQLKKGANRLLAKVCQGYGNWEFAARLLPADADKPLITMGATGSTNGNMARLPLITVDLLDADGKSTTTWHVSGGRAGGSAAQYTIYAAAPDPEPAKVRVHFDEPGFLPFDKTFNWSQAKRGSVWVSFGAKDRIRGRVVDDKNGQPVADAEFFAGESPLAKPSDAQGRFEFTMKDPLADIVEIRAPGYEPLETRVEHAGEWTVKIAPGGQTIRGRVLSTAGEPISGARITAYAGRRNINLRTDADGRFQISGLSKNDNEIYPTVSHQDFTAKDGFQQPLDADGITEVEWRLEPGCIVTGRVTAQADGRPLGGIQIVSGSDRFASNRANPETTTDEDGRFRLGGVKAGTAMVHAISRQFVPMLVNVNTSLDQPATADFALVTGKPISGRVVDPEGKPVAGVTAAIDTINGARMLDRRVDTNANGEFRYENMPDTPVKIDMFKQGWVSKRDFESKGGEHADITLYPVVEHIVRVRAADTDKPPKDLTSQIGYQWSGREEISWQEEDYSDNSEYDPSSGLLKIHVDEPSSSAQLFWRLRAPGYKEVVLPNPEIGTPAKSIDVVMEKVATTRGTVVNADTNEPIPGVLVALVSKQDRLRPDYYTNFNSGFEAIESFTGYHATTAADGTFEISRPAADSGVDLVLYSKTGGFHFIPDAHAALAGGDVKLPLPSPATVEGRVVVAGQTIAGAPVHLSWIAPGDRARSYELPFGFGGQVETDSQGRFRYTGLGPGNYQVSRVRRFEYPSGGGSSYTFITSQEVLVLPGQTVTHDFVQPIGPKISGQVVNPDGKPAGFCQASLTLAGSQNRQADATYTQGNGRFEFENVQPGTYSIRIQEYVATQWGGFGPTGGNATTTVKVADSDVATTITLVPRPESRTPNAAPRATATLSFVAASPNASNSMAGALPPDFRGKVFGTDKTFQLSDNYGKVVIVAFWASWSGSFATVMPELQQLYEKHKGSDDVVFVIVSFDRTAEALQAAIVEQELEIPVIYESRESGHNIAKGFGMVGVPSSFVIGRDGRLASERVYNNQLISTVEAAIKAPAPPQLPTGGKPARLTINLSLDGDASGLPGATLTVKSFNDVGMPVNEEVLRTVGPAPKLTWFHPPLDERGSMEVKVEAEGVESQQQTVKASGDSAELTFKFSSPRAIRGTVALAAEKKGTEPKDAAASLSPAPNMKVAAYSMNGIRRDATTDADGKFEMRVMPGTYFIVPISNEKFAAVSVERQQLNVAADQDPEPLELSVCPSVTVSGSVTDENDQPVAGAEVRTPLTEKPAITDNQGRFQLSGVPSRGTVQLIATKQPKFAVVSLENCDGKEPQTLVLGDQPGGAERRLAKGMKAPKLPLVSLSDGEPVDWQPAAGRETLLLFGPLWHPGTRDLVMRAEAWADEHQADLATISTDWSLDQARREAASYADVLPAGDVILFAGPGGLELAKTWALQGQAQAYLLSPDGKKIGAVPPPGKLP